MSAVFVLLLLLSGVFSETVTRLTNVKCEVLDISYCAYKQCDLKVLGRGIIGLNAHAILLKGPFNNAKVNIGLFRKFNGFRPFMINTTIDFCKFMSKKDYEISAARIFFLGLFESTSINHSCPYENELIVREFVMKEEYFKYAPLPSGEYQLRIRAATDGQWKTMIYVNFLRKEDLLKN